MNGASPLTDKDVDQEARDQGISERIRKIVHPTKYEEIEQTRNIAQAARIRNENLGLRFEQQSKRRRSIAREQLDQLFSKLRADNVQLTRAQYAEFIEGYSITKDIKGCLSVLREMRENSITPTLAQYNLVLKMAADDGYIKAIYDAGEEMRIAGIRDTDSNYLSFFNQLLVCLGRCAHTEHAYSVYLEMKQRGLVPQRNGYHELILKLGDIGEVGLAFDALQEALGNAMSFEQSTYLGLLRSAGTAMHYDAYRFCYTQLTTVFGSQLTEGDYEAGLSIGARQGDLSLVKDIVRRLEQSNYYLEEYHFEPLFECLVTNRQWSAAFKALHMMREGSLGTTPATLRNLTRALAAEPAQAEELVDSVFALLVDNRADFPKAADTTTVNALIRALAHSGCLDAAIDRLDRWYPQLDLKRDIDTYVYLLEGCAKMKNMDVAEAAMTKLLDSDRLQPNKKVYELMIHVSLNQFNYEDAFVYLESMKAHHMLPDWKTYSKIVRRCARVRDPRAKIALEEMRSLGYVVTPLLQAFASTSGKSVRHAPSPKRSHANLDDKQESSKAGGSSADDIFDLSDLLSRDSFKL
ncbi:hypothetical protein GGI12_000003 [Dipsacomyces acuminosporus]|nr:hypothetical protein GGI12_000003 [Dipsacomyces acuminosporus]